VTFTAWAIGSGFAGRYIAEPCWRKRRAMRRAAECGVNGDDLVFPSKERGVEWLRGVAAVGGKASRGKSLCSEIAFTVNSELWWRKDKNSPWEAPGAIRPTLLFGIVDGRKANPDVLWDSYSRCGWLDPYVKGIIEGRLKSFLPRSMGGLGRDVAFDVKAVKEWKRRRAAKVKAVVLPRGSWNKSEVLDYQTRMGEKKEVVVARRHKKYLQKLVNEPWKWKAKWTVKGELEVPDYVGTDVQELFDDYVWHVWLDLTDQVVLRLPTFALGAAKALGGQEVAEGRGIGRVRDLEAESCWEMSVQLSRLRAKDRRWVRRRFAGVERTRTMPDVDNIKRCVWETGA